MLQPRLVFVDDSGIDWRIYELPGERVPASRGRRCLIFESDRAIRRVWNFPDNWLALSSSELSRLSWNV
jgi:hypothetical protein